MILKCIIPLSNPELPRLKVHDEEHLVGNTRYTALYGHTDLVTTRVVWHAGAAAAGPAGEGPGAGVSPLPAAPHLLTAHPAAPARQPGQQRLKMGGRRNRAVIRTWKIGLTSDFAIQNLLRHYSKRAFKHSK